MNDKQIDLKELRRLAEAAKKYDDCTKIDHWNCINCKEKADCYDLERQYANEIKRLINNPAAIIAPLDRLEAAEKVCRSIDSVCCEDYSPCLVVKDDIAYEEWQKGVGGNA